MKSLPIRPVPQAPQPAPNRVRVDQRWRLSRLASAPHRLGFGAAALLFALSALWWAGVIAARAAGWALPWALPPPAAHGLLMSLSFMPLFIAGFAFTAGPRWLALPETDPASMRWPVSLMVGGWLLALAGFHLNQGLAALGLACVSGGWSLLVWRLAALLRASGVADKTHARVLVASCAVGAVVMMAASAALALGETRWLALLSRVALWAFAAPVFAAVSHRMIPFFSASALPGLTAWKPNALLWLMVGVLWLQAAMAVAWALLPELPAILLGLNAMASGAMALLLLGVAVQWGLLQSLRIRLLAMLHAGFVWLGIALALVAWDNGARALAWGEGLGLAPLHALGMGYLGTTLIAMITRVAAGHSGRALVADDFAWALYWTAQIAVLLRVAAALWPQAAPALTLAAGAAWAAAALAWALRYGGWMGRPRVDGRPG